MTTTESTQIHPEIPRAPWVTNRYLDDEDRLVVDEYEYDDGMFNIQIGTVHSVTENPIDTRPTSILVRWINQWPGESGVDREDFTVFPKDIPALIAVLERAARPVEEAPDAAHRIKARLRADGGQMTMGEAHALCVEAGVDPSVVIGEFLDER